MNNTYLSTLKTKLKTHLINENLKDKKNFIFVFDKNVIKENGSNFKITKHQYSKNKIATILDKNKLKFPLILKEFQNETLKKELNPSLIKIFNLLFLSKKDLTLYKLKDISINYILNKTLSSTINLLKVIKLHIKNSKIIS